MSCNGFFCSEDSLCKMCRMKNSTKLILDTFVPYFKNKGDFESVKILENYFDLPDWQLKELYKFFKVDPWDINCNWDRESYDLWNECVEIKYANRARYFINDLKYWRPYACKTCNNKVKAIDTYCEECTPIYDFDKNGFNIDGLHRNGTYYNEYGFDKYGYNRGGFNKSGYNRSGFDKDGFDRQGYNIKGEYKYSKPNKSRLNNINSYSSYEEEPFDVNDFLESNGYDPENDTIEDMYNLD